MTSKGLLRSTGSFRFIRRQAQAGELVPAGPQRQGQQTSYTSREAGVQAPGRRPAEKAAGRSLRREVSDPRFF